MSRRSLTDTDIETGIVRRRIPSSPQPQGLPQSNARSWRVIHACEAARDVLDVVESQIIAGMKPYIVTPEGAGAGEAYLSRKDVEQVQALSLLRAWQDVRNWRKSLLDCDPENTADVLHTHSFAAGMAGVRNFSCVIYDLLGCIEELGMSDGQCEQGSWMGRSFRVAEQFVLSRAKAVVVHSLGMKAAVEERGALPENVFVVPGPMDLETAPPASTGEANWGGLGIPESALVYMVASPAGVEEGEARNARLGALEAFAAASGEVPDSVLLIESSDAAVQEMKAHAQRLNITPRLFCLPVGGAQAVLEIADVVVATGESPADPVSARNTSEICLRTLALGKALLAADVPRNRDATPEGRGCLWFKNGDVRDLGHRMAFLGHNPDFRASLARAARDYIVETRSSKAVGQKYDVVYRHAASRKRSGKIDQNVTSLQPLTSSGW